MPKVRHVPQRQCVACRQMRPKRELMRVVRLSTGEVRVDPTGKASGRGAYVCPTEECIDAAARDRRLDHALTASVPSSCIEDLRAAVRRPTKMEAGKV